LICTVNFDGDNKEDILIICGRDVYLLRNNITDQKLKDVQKRNTPAYGDSLILDALKKLK
jgi:hypothetical protein